MQFKSTHLQHHRASPLKTPYQPLLHHHSAGRRTPLSQESHHQPHYQFRCASRQRPLLPARHNHYFSGSLLNQFTPQTFDNNTEHVWKYAPKWATHHQRITIQPAAAPLQRPYKPCSTPRSATTSLQQPQKSCSNPNSATTNHPVTTLP